MIEPGLKLYLFKGKRYTLHGMRSIHKREKKIREANRKARNFKSLTVGQ